MEGGREAVLGCLVVMVILRNILGLAGDAEVAVLLKYHFSIDTERHLPLDLP